MQLPVTARLSAPGKILCSTEQDCDWYDTTALEKDASLKLRVNSEAEAERAASNIEESRSRKAGGEPP